MTPGPRRRSRSRDHARRPSQCAARLEKRPHAPWPGTRSARRHAAHSRFVARTRQRNESNHEGSPKPHIASINRIVRAHRGNGASCAAIPYRDQRTANVVVDSWRSSMTAHRITVTAATTAVLSPSRSPLAPLRWPSARTDTTRSPGTYLLESGHGHRPDQAGRRPLRPGSPRSCNPRSSMRSTALFAGTRPTSRRSERR